jgi:3-carboxy-cis,cis-muconate cycloisomerase
MVRPRPPPVSARILRHRARLAALGPDLCQVSLSGAAGTLSAMGPLGPQVRAGVAEALGLSDPGHSWHSERDTVAAFAATMANLTASLGKMGEDLLLLTQSGQAEVVLQGAGGSSTMPQKQNPVGPSVLVALARQTAGLAATLQGAVLHRQQRDGASWFTEWLALPQLCILTGRALTLALEVADKITPDPAAMARGLDADRGLIRAEALTFALTTRMSRPDAAAAVKALAARVRTGEGDLMALVRKLWPDLTLTDDLGTAPDEARAFARLSCSGQGQDGA